MESIKLVKDAKLDLIIAQSGGETNETLIVDFAVAVGANYVKLGLSTEEAYRNIIVYLKLTEKFNLPLVSLKNRNLPVDLCLFFVYFMVNLRYLI
jgi:acetyl-CoA carboxylase alpha subunit